MQIQLNNVNYKGKFFEEVTIDIPKLNDYNDNNRGLIDYYICKELDRRIRG